VRERERGGVGGSGRSEVLSFALQEKQKNVVSCIGVAGKKKG